MATTTNPNRRSTTFSKDKLHSSKQGIFLATWDQYLLFLDVDWKKKFHKTKSTQNELMNFFADMGLETEPNQLYNK